VVARQWIELYESGGEKSPREENGMETFDWDFMEEMKPKLGVDVIGVASVELPTPQRLKGMADSLLPGVKSMVVLGKEMYKEVVALLQPCKEVGEAEYGDLLGPHCDYINARLNRAIYELASLLRLDGYRTLPLPAAGCPYDQRFLMAIFSFKHAAQAAGLGRIGRHSLLIAPEYGPRLRLACLLTEAPLEPTPVQNRDFCIDCDACIRECPAEALHMPGNDEAYSMNKFACQAYRRAGLTCSLCVKACDEILG
jgi:epoxyqueuosine reductase QueG